MFGLSSGAVITLQAARMYSRAMRIGRDHIAPTVHAIAFATAGMVLPVLVLIVIYKRPLLGVLQTEQCAGELIRAMVGSIGLVLAVPLTTAIGVAVVRATSGDLPRTSEQDPDAAHTIATSAADHQEMSPRPQARGVEDSNESDRSQPEPPAPRRARR